MLMNDSQGRKEKRQLTRLPRQFPMEGFATISDVLSVYPVGKSALYEDIRNSRFPKPIKRGRSSFWDAVEVRRILIEMGATMALPEQSS